MKYRQYILIFFSLVIFSLLTSCSPWVVINQGSTDAWMTLDSTHTIGQTFVADYSGFQAINLYLTPQSPGDGFLILHIRSDPDSTLDLTTVKLPIQEVNTTKYYRFDFPSIPNSNNQYYYGFLSMDSSGSVQVGSGQANAYLNGAAYQNHVPIEAQLSYSVDYDRSMMIIGILKQVIPWVLISIIGFLLFTIPGWALLSIFWRGWNDLFWSVKLALSIGTSMALYTLLVLFTFLVHLQLGVWYVWIPIIAGILVLAWQNKHNLLAIISKKTQFHPGKSNTPDKKTAFWLDFSLVIVLGLIFFSRFWAMRGLDEPMWNDSLHHTEITQLIMDNQGLFTSWLPYAPYQTFSMHFGFPLIAALLGWITGLISSQSVLYSGQILNIFAILALYPLALKITNGNRIGGVVAVLVAGLLSPMPAFYINWGRYAQLGGQVLLPIAMWMVWEIVDEASIAHVTRRWLQIPWTKIIISGGMIAGMILFEFRMIFIITSFVITLSLGLLIKNGRLKLRKWLQELLPIFMIGIISILLFLPWGLRILNSKLINYSGFNSQASTLSDLIRQDYQTWQNIHFYVPIVIIILGLAGWMLALIKRNWIVVSLGLWVALMASLYSLITLHVPWIQYVQSFAVVISLYIPAGLFVGYLVAVLTPRLFKWKLGGILTFAFVVGFGLLGTWNQRNIANPDVYGHVTRPDLRAMEWINRQTPPDSLFLIEGMHENWVSNVIGTDAGWWIPILARRENTIPPQYALSNEMPIVVDYSQKVIDLEAELENNGIVSQAGIDLLCEFGVTHVYIGQKQGMVANTSEPLINPDELAVIKGFQMIYHQDRVYIYSVAGACGQ